LSDTKYITQMIYCDNIADDIINEIDIDELFIASCQNGRIEIAKWLWTTISNTIDIETITKSFIRSFGITRIGFIVDSIIEWGSYD
jgi:hypothetical protein